MNLVDDYNGTTSIATSTINKPKHVLIVLKMISFHFSNFHLCLPRATGFIFLWTRSTYRDKINTMLIYDHSNVHVIITITLFPVMIHRTPRDEGNLSSAAPKFHTDWF